MTEWTVSVTRDIAADSGAIYDLIADITRMGEWSPENTACTWKDGFDSPVVGAEWIGENVGSPPDIEVLLDARSVAEGRDPQLERGVEEALKALEREPARTVTPPAYPRPTAR